MTDHSKHSDACGCEVAELEAKLEAAQKEIEELKKKLRDARECWCNFGSVNPSCPFHGGVPRP